MTAVLEFDACGVRCSAAFDHAKMYAFCRDARFACYFSKEEFEAYQNMHHDRWDHIVMVPGIFREFATEINAKIDERLSERNREIAKKLKSTEMSVDKISKITGLSIDEVNEL